MRKKSLTVPLLGALAATRALGGIGAGLLLSRRIQRERRRRLGWALFGIGAATTIPIAMAVFRRG